MRVQRSYLVRVIQVYEGEPPADGWRESEPSEMGDYLYGEDDQYVCDNWQLVSDHTEAIDDDELETVALDSEGAA